MGPSSANTRSLFSYSLTYVEQVESLLHYSNKKTSFHRILHSSIKIGVATLALRLPIDNTYIHTYFSKHIIL